MSVFVYNYSSIPTLVLSGISTFPNECLTPVIILWFPLPSFQVLVFSQMSASLPYWYKLKFINECMFLLKNPAPKLQKCPPSISLFAFPSISAPARNQPVPFQSRPKEVVVKATERGEWRENKRRDGRGVWGKWIGSRLPFSINSCNSLSTAKIPQRK